MAERGRPALVPPTHASSERLSCQAHSLNFGTGGFEFAFYFPQHDGGTDIREYRLAEEYPPGSRISRVVLGHPPARAGATSDAKEILSEWTNTWPTQYVSRVHLAITCVGRERNCLELARDSVRTGFPCSLAGAGRFARDGRR